MTVVFTAFARGVDDNGLYPINFLNTPGDEGTPALDGSSVTYTDPSSPGDTITLTGTGITGTPTSGWNITSITASYNGHTQWTITGLSGVDGTLPSSGVFDSHSLFEAVAFHNPHRFLFGNDPSVVIIGGPGNEILIGGPSNDYIRAGSGNDRLGNSGGNDTLVGGPGHDLFVLNNFPNQVDTVQKYNVLRDHIGLDTAGFAELTGTPELRSNEFTKGKHAVGHHAQMVYNPGNGHLFYDPHGTSGPQIEIALMHAHLALTASDFLLV